MTSFPPSITGSIGPRTCVTSVESVLVVHVEAVAAKPGEQRNNPPKIAMGGGPVAASL